jgi:hypothetical protein
MNTIKLMLVLGLLGAGVYVCAEIIPPYFANYQFQDTVENEAKLDTYSTKSEDNIRETIFRKAQDLEIPITKDQIKVQRVGAQGTGSVYIGMEYTVHVDLPGYPMDLHFHPESKNKGVF